MCGGRKAAEGDVCRCRLLGSGAISLLLSRSRKVDRPLYPAHIGQKCSRSVSLPVPTEGWKRRVSQRRRERRKTHPNAKLDGSLFSDKGYEAFVYFWLGEVGGCYDVGHFWDGSGLR